jgi:membrane-associated phospholipid phosphatase
MVGLTTGGLFLVEKSVRRRVGDTEEAHEWNSLIRPLGLAPTFGLVTGGFLTSGYLLERPEDLATARLLVEAVIIDQMFVEGLKLTSGRARPNANGGDTSFAPLTGGKSFPSGETSFAFTVAGVVSEQYDQAPVKVLAYGLATAVGAARIAEDAHWASDVFVGAALGLAVSRAVVRRHSARSSHPGSGQKDKNSNFIVFPAGLLWEYRF